jgi:hypothetical protein
MNMMSYSGGATTTVPPEECLGLLGLGDGAGV